MSLLERSRVWMLKPIAGAILVTMSSSISQKLTTSVLTLRLSLSASDSTSQPDFRMANPTNFISVTY